MDIKCKVNPYYFIPSSSKMTSFQGVVGATKRVVNQVSSKASGVEIAGLCEDIFVKRPVASKNATGLLGLINKSTDSVKKYFRKYKKNIQHTYEHKIVFSLIEKELFGKNSIDSLTHDLDKLVLYLLGFPKSFVSSFHRRISVHHTESGKKNNLRSMLCDNIASSPEFKPEKKKSLRDHYNTSIELQKVAGFKELLEKYNYGEDLDFNKIKDIKDFHKKGFSNNLKRACRAMTFFIF